LAILPIGILYCNINNPEHNVYLDLSLRTNVVSSL